MRLYYDNKTLLFGTVKTETSECIFESYESTGHEGWSKGKNPIIQKGNVEIVIHTNYWPEKVNYEWFRADIKVNGTLLLPLSNCYKEGTFHKPSFTISKGHDTFKWSTFLLEICQISNYSDAWLNDELEKLLAKLPQDSSNLENQIQVLKMIRTFDTANPFYRKKYRNYFDALFFDTEMVKPLLDDVMNKSDKTSIELFDVVWNYIKDYASSRIDVVD